MVGVGRVVVLLRCPACPVHAARAIQAKTWRRRREQEKRGRERNENG